MCRETTATSTGSKMYLGLLALVVDRQTFKAMFCLLQLSTTYKQNSEAFRHSSRIQKSYWTVMRIFSPSQLLSCCKMIQSLLSGKCAFLIETEAQFKPNKTLSICWVVESNQSVFLHLSYMLQECSFAKNLQYKSSVSKLTYIFHLPQIWHLSISKQVAKLQFHFQSRLPNQTESELF